jgi:hypothetical protein
MNYVDLVEFAQRLVDSAFVDVVDTTAGAHQLAVASTIRRANLPLLLVVVVGVKVTST